MNYHDYNDAKGRDSRLRVEAWRDARGRMLATFREMDFGAVTLYMPKYDVQLRAREAARMNAGGAQS